MDRCHTAESAERFLEILRARKLWMAQRVLEYAHDHGYTRDTSTQIDAWRMSIERITDSLAAAIRLHGGVPALRADDCPDGDPAAAFAVEAARRHRSRNVTLACFLGLYRYYHAAYRDAVEDQPVEMELRQCWLGWLDAFFTRGEIAICSEWVSLPEPQALSELQAMARTLANENSRYLSVIESVPTPILLLDEAGSLEHWNAAAAEVLRLPASADAAKHRASAIAAYQEALGHLVGPAMVMLAAPEGERIYTAERRGLHDASRRSSGAVVVLHDETHNVCLARAVRESEVRFRAFADTAQDAIIVMGASGTVHFWNRGAELLFGWTALEVVGRPLHHVLASPTQQASFAQAHEIWRRTGTGPVVGKMTELPAAHRDGHALRVELSVTSIQNGGEWSAIGIVRDVTERRAAEERMRAAEQRWQFALEGGGDGVWDWDIDSGQMVFTDRFPEMLGYVRGDANFPSDFDGLCELIHPDDAAGLADALQAHFFAPGTSFAVDYRMRAMDGEWRWVHSRGKVTDRDADGRPRRMVGTHRDVDDERANQEALRRQLAETQRLATMLEEANLQVLQSEKMASLGQLSAGIAHELNSPIGYVGSNLSTLRHYVDGLLDVLEKYEQATSGAAAESLAGVREASTRCDLAYVREDLPVLFSESREGVERVQRIVRDLKEFSHAGSDDWNHFDLNSGIQSTLNIVRNETKYKAEVVCEFGQLPEVWCIPSQINQVILNLIVNAAHAIESKGQITIRTACDGDSICLEVRDTGCGIPPEIQKRIFEPFFTTKPVGKGTGLGLSITYGIVQRHAGRIEVDSVPGTGTAFRVILPLHGNQ
jgi:two-component system NtrC family sensor kinase